MGNYFSQKNLSHPHSPMKLGLFTIALASTAAASFEDSWMEESMFGQVSAESLDFNEMFDDAADFFIQIGAEERQSLGQNLLQVESMADDFIANMQPAERKAFETIYAQTRNNAFTWLSQIE